MTHFAFVTLPYLGHMNPMLALASELASRGHRTTFFHVADAALPIRRRGHGFVALGAGSHPTGWLSRATDHLGRADRLTSLPQVMRDFASLTAMFCEELPAALREAGADLIVVDQCEAAGGLVAYRLGLPFVSLAAALPLNWDASVPSPFVGWRPGATRLHRARNVVGHYAAWKLREPVNAVIGDYAARWRLGLGPRVEDCMSGLAQISQLVPSLDFRRNALIGCFHYCGPLREPVAAGSHCPRERRVFISFGSLQGHRIALFEALARAARVAGYAPVVAHGGRLATAEAARLARWAEVHAFLPQGPVLDGSDAAIVHGGLNTVLDAAARGVPLIVRPIAFEQAAIAARVRASGAGRVLRAGPALRSTLARLIRMVAADGSGYRAAAARLRDEIVGAGGVRRAADIVVHVASTGRPALNAEGLSRLSRETALDDHRELVARF